MTLLHHQNFHHHQIRSKKVKTTLADGQVQQYSGPVLHWFACWVRALISKTFISSSDALDALAEHIEKNCCWGKGPMEKMKVKSVEPSTAYKYLMNRLVRAN